jgi:hypothetical protein
MSTRMVQIECKIACFFAEMQPILATFVAKVARNNELLPTLQEVLGKIRIYSSMVCRFFSKCLLY